MKIYYAPEFARQVELASTRHQNMVKFISGFFEHHEKAQIFAPSRIKVQILPDQKLYSIQLDELRILASLVADNRGEYWIFAQLDQHW